jgi:hypothetical protein
MYYEQIKKILKKYNKKLKKKTKRLQINGSLY